MNKEYNSCVEGCSLPSSPNDLKILLNNIKREVDELVKTTEAKLLYHDGKIAELTKYIKDNLSNSIRCLLDSMMVSGELNEIIINAISNDLDLLNDCFVFPEKYGAIGDGIHDDTIAIQKALNEGKYIIFDNKTYLVRTDRTNCLKVKNDTYLIGNNTTLKGINDNNDISNILYLQDVKNIYIKGFTLYGDAEVNTKTSEGAGHGIYINGSENIHIENVYAHDCFTDGIYIRGNNITVKDSICKHNGRQGISITHGENIKLENVECDDSYRVAPMAGIDIEPSLETDYVDNIILRDIKTSKNKGFGLAIGLNHMKKREKCVINIDNFTDDGSANPLEIGMHLPEVKMKGSININHFTSINAPQSAIIIRHRDSKKCVPVNINDPVIVNANTIKTTLQYGRGIYFYDGTNEIKSGNVRFNNIMFEKCENIVGHIFAPQNLENVYVINSPDIKEVISSINYVGHYPKSRVEITESGTYSILNLQTIVKLSNAGSIAFRNPVYATNDILTIIQDNDIQTFYEFKLPILGLSNNGKVNCSTKGSVLQLMNVKNEYYILISKTGTWNV